MTSARRPPIDPRRARRLRVLTRLTVVAWVTALALSLVPVVVGGAAGPGPAETGGIDAPHAGKASPGATSTPSANTPGGNGDNSGARATQKPHPTRKPAASPGVTPTPAPSSTPAPASTPRPSHRPASSATPRPERSHKPGPGGAGGGNAETSPSPRGGTAPGAGGGGSPAPGTTGRSGAGTTAAATARPEEALTVPGPFGHGAAGAEESGTEGGLEADIYLDFDLAGTLEVFTPAALLALPGLLILASLLAQVAGGILWIPLTHRLLGGRARTLPPARSRRRA